MLNRRMSKDFIFSSPLILKTTFKSNEPQWQFACFENACDVQATMKVFCLESPKYRLEIAKTDSLVHPSAGDSTGEGEEIMRDTAAIILAAGQGKRMRSKTPKVLHRMLGQSLISFPLRLAEQTGCDAIVAVVGHGLEAVKNEVLRLDRKGAVSFAVQSEQRGTGHAVMCALPCLEHRKGRVLILSGDVPMLDEASVSALEKEFEKSGVLAMLTFVPKDPTGYGRIIRKDGRPVAIREHRDCTEDERSITEVNAGVYLIDLPFLRTSISGLKADNDQGELYLTDLAAEAAKISEVGAAIVDAHKVAGINDRAELQELEGIMSRKRNLELLRSGVTIHDPDSVRIEWDVTVGQDTEIFASVHIGGTTSIGEGCVIGQGSVLNNCTIADRVTIKPYTVADDARLDSGCEVGPMARLRPGAHIGEGAHIGNWVEVKNTLIGKGSKANHLAYLGDGIVGDGVNIGAGTIFCNYDGFMKHKTVLGNGVFIGSDSQLVAPVTVGDGAYVASGSTITHDVPKNDLALSRVKQVNKTGRAAILKTKLQLEKERRLAEKAAKEKDGK
jgi:bifunctional UDP-N-acetylglucosamine pyrophosphorylase/glucosamine-1-phosphate N-acetyltransferase